MPSHDRQVGREAEGRKSGEAELPADVAHAEPFHRLRQARLVDGVEIAIEQAIGHVAEVEEQEEERHRLGEGGRRERAGAGDEERDDEQDRDLRDHELGTADAEGVLPGALRAEDVDAAEVALLAARERAAPVEQHVVVGDDHVARLPAVGEHGLGRGERLSQLGDHARRLQRREAEGAHVNGVEIVDRLGEAQDGGVGVRVSIDHAGGEAAAVMDDALGLVGERQRSPAIARRLVGALPDARGVHEHRLSAVDLGRRDAMKEQITRQAPRERTIVMERDGAVRIEIVPGGGIGLELVHRAERPRLQRAEAARRERERRLVEGREPADHEHAVRLDPRVNLAGIERLPRRPRGDAHLEAERRERRGDEAGEVHDTSSMCEGRPFTCTIDAPSFSASARCMRRTRAPSRTATPCQGVSHASSVARSEIPILMDTSGCG
jgi:hypothetical protein